MQIRSGLQAGILFTGISMTVLCAGLIALGASAPVILVQPTDQGVLAGSNATFNVTADGTPKPTYTWQFNGSDISGATGTTLTISNVQPSNGGSYSVAISNNQGYVKSSLATLLALGATNTLDFQLLPAVAGVSISSAGQYYREKGFILSPKNTSAGYFAYWQTNSVNYPGSIALFDNNTDDYACLSRSDGGYFDLNSIDLCTVQYNVPQTVTLIGYDGFEIVATYDAQLSGSLVLQTFQTPGLTHLTEVRWQQLSPGNQFDNIVVYAQPENGTPPRIDIGNAKQFNSTLPLFLTHLRVQKHYAIKKSTDLLNWQPFKSITANTTSILSADYYNPAAPSAYYVLQIVP
jgi:hypothetical protein